MKIIFNKYEGTGNDFIIIDNRLNTFIADHRTIARLCDRRFGIGADGLILIGNQNGHSFRMNYYNSDGYEGTMCGNGGRCAADFAFRHSIADADMSFIASDGIHRAIVTDNSVTLFMSDVRDIKKYDSGCFLNTGSPHYVEFVSDPEAINVVEAGRKLRYSSQFGPGGTNVNFAGIRNDHITVRTYERGVEDETLSCGTGVTASVIAAVYSGHFDSSSVPVRTRGGNLTVDCRLEGNRAYDVRLTGPATFVFSGEINL